jgi:anaerobic selenocysteine-containing dehydrogenase
VNTLYDLDRLLSPLKRSGERGEGQWTRISWDQAFQEISKRLTALYQKGKTESLWVEMGLPGSRDLLVLNFLKAFGNTAGKSNEWFPVNLGTDEIVALAMAQHIIQQRLHDKDFLILCHQVHPRTQACDSCHPINLVYLKKGKAS